MISSALDRLSEVHPDMEIWWDSSPLIFKPWVKKMVENAPKNKKASLKEQLNRIYNVSNPEKSLIRGCTTNPPLSLAAVNSDLPFWNKWVDNMIKSNKRLSRYEYFILTYKEVIKRGAEMMLPIWKATAGKYGYISGQLDPRLITETKKMIEMAKEFHTIAPNVMIKVPASTEGVEVVRVLSSLGISTNVTTCFSLPQIWAVAKAAKEGMELGLKNKVDMSKWRGVITMMIGRLTEHPVLDQQAEKRGIKLSWSDKHWLGAYVFRKAYQLLEENAMPSKMIACSLRAGPVVNGKNHFWDIEKIAGNIIYTMPPYVLEPLFNNCSDLNFKEEILLDDVPEEVLFKMSKIPYIRQAWDENGMEEDQFNTFPATVATAELFSKASEGLENYVGERMSKLKINPPAGGK